MKRILYFTGYRMVAQEWDGQKLHSSVYFEPDEQGLDLFEAYLTTPKHEPVRLLIDLIEEEFHQIVIPFLRGSDRQGIIDRHYTKFFRNSDYRCATSQGVIKKRRKEEKLLLMGLTNQDIIAPWLSVIDKTKTPLSGILSLPLASENLVSDFKTEQECIIMVSQQVPSNLRQSVFINGNLVLSRLVPIASFYKGDYASDVIRDIEGTQRYLVSQRLIDRNDTVSVQILCNKRHVKKFKDKDKDKDKDKGDDSDIFDYKIHDLNDFIKDKKIELHEEQDFSSALFCAEAAKGVFTNHYARGKEKKYFYHHIASFAFKVAAISFFAVSSGLLLTSLAKGYLYESSISEMNTLQQKYETKFKQLNEQKIDSVISTSNMKSVVQTVNALQKDHLMSPQYMMAMVSQDIALFPDMRITSLEWMLASSMDASAPDKQAVVTAKNQRKRGRNSGAPGKQRYEIIEVSGELLNFDGDYRYALSLINDIEDAMNISKKYTQVTITQRPLNIESGESLSGDVSIKVNRRSSGNKKAKFALRIVKEVKLNEK